MFLNNREMAILFWLFLASIFLLQKSEFRHSVKAFQRALFVPFVIFVTSALLIWVAVGVHIFSNFYDLSFSDYKVIFYWTAFSAVASVYFIEIKASSVGVVSFWLRESISVILFVSFIVNFHIFPLYVELILQPFIFFVAATMAFSSGRKDYQPAFKFFLGLLVATLSVLSFASIKGLVLDPVAATQHLFSTVIAPMLLSIYFVPFLVVFNAFLIFDERARRLKRLRVIEKFSFSICLKLFLCFGFSLRYFDRWCRFVTLHSPKSTEDVFATIFEVSRNIRDQIEWRLHYCGGGWSPVILMRALSSFSINIHYYDRHIFDWYGESEPVYHNGDRRANYIKYSICGERCCVKEIVLELDILDADGADEAADLFSRIVESIIKRISSDSIVIEGDNFCVQLENARFTVSTFYSGNENEFAHREVTIQRFTGADGK